MDRVHSGLIERLEAAEFGSAELDAEICVLFRYGGENSEDATNVRTDPEWEGDLLFEVGADECCNPIPSLTTSLDAALALAERVLGRAFRLGLIQQPDGTWEAATLWSDEEQDDRDVAFGHAPTPALALCIAILRAKTAGYEPQANEPNKSQPTDDRKEAK